MEDGFYWAVVNGTKTVVQVWTSAFGDFQRVNLLGTDSVLEVQEIQQWGPKIEEPHF